MIMKECFEKVNFGRLKGMQKVKLLDAISKHSVCLLG